jgi:GRASP55/65 PDZ-like domain
LSLKYLICWLSSCILVFAVVFNIKSQEARIVYLTPSDGWGGAGLLGVTIRLDNYAGAEDRFIRVLSVDTDNGSSPASVAGLLGDGNDFILGTTHHTINSLSHFAQLLNDNMDRVIELYVYNSSTDVVRVVPLLPSYEWNKNGGKGLLGAEVGTGYLHRLPYKSRSTSGSCVERKVRYVPTAHKDGNVLLVEDAPQMEMEPPDTDDDDNSDNVEELYTEPKRSSLPVEQALEVKNGTSLSGAVATADVFPVPSVEVHAERPSSEIPGDVTSTGASSVSQEPDPAPVLSSAPPPPQNQTLEATRPPPLQPFAPPPLLAHRAMGIRTAPGNAWSPLGAPPVMGAASATAAAVRPTAASYSANPVPPAVSPPAAPGPPSYSGGGPSSLTTSYGSHYSAPPHAYSYTSTMPPVGYRPYSSSSTQQ